MGPISLGIPSEKLKNYGVERGPFLVLTFAVSSHVAALRNKIGSLVATPMTKILITEANHAVSGPAGRRSGE